MDVNKRDYSGGDLSATPQHYTEDEALSLLAQVSCDGPNTAYLSFPVSWLVFSQGSIGISLARRGNIIKNRPDRLKLQTLQVE